MRTRTIRPQSGYLAVLLIALILLDAMLLWLAPAEQTLGQVVKLVYLHGALISASMLGFVVAGALGLVWLFARRGSVLHWMMSLQRAAALTWLIYLISSVWVTYLAWGVAIAWGEPRVEATLRVTLAVVVILIVTEIVKMPLLTAVGNALLAIVTILVIQSAGVIRHPVNPIGTSASAGIKWFYAGIVATTISVVGIGTALLRGRAHRPRHPGK